jgi:hypothetical protein
VFFTFPKLDATTLKEERKDTDDEQEENNRPEGDDAAVTGAWQFAIGFWGGHKRAI